MANKTVLCIKRNSWEEYRFLFEKTGEYTWRLYVPDNNPLVYGVFPVMRLTFESNNNPFPHPMSFNLRFTNTIPCVPFRHGINFYKCCWEGTYLFQEDLIRLTLELGNYSNGEWSSDPRFLTASEGWKPEGNNMTELHLPEFMGRMWDSTYKYWKYMIRIPVSLSKIEELAKETYGVDTASAYISAAIVGEEDMYWNLYVFGVFNDCVMMYVDNYDDATNSFENLRNSQWLNDMRISYQIYVNLGYNNFPELSDEEMEDVEGSRDYVLNIISAAKAVTREDWAKMLADQSAIMVNEQKSIFDDMQVNNIRLINKNIQNVIEMTAETDSKSNIVQPIFYRVRDAASIVVHPAVTENICINLDSYKSSCASFIIQIEGQAFPEIGRTENGSIFKIQGNMLPRRSKAGIYYVLNQDSELVTMGKYVYEG